MKHFRSPHAARRAIKARLCLAAVVACTGAGLAQAGIVTDPGGMALANCPLAAFQYVCVVEGRARVDGTTAAPIEKVRISRTSGYHNGEFSFIEGFAPAAGTSFEFLSAGNAAPTLTGVQYSYTGLEPGFEFEVSAGGDGRLVFTALTNGVSVVPEPAAWWLAAFGLGLLYLVPKMRSPASPRPGTM